MSNSAKQSSFLLALLPLVILYAGAAVLVVLSRDGLGGMVQYWEFFVPVVAVISLMSGWGQAYVNGNSRLMYLIKQIIIWGLLIAILWMFQTLGITSALGDQKYALVLLALLVLTAITVGLALDFKLFFFGIFLAAGAYLLAVPADTTILTTVGEIFRIAEPQNKPQTIVATMALVGFVISAFFLVSVRGAIMAKRIRAK